MADDYNCKLWSINSDEFGSHGKKADELIGQ